MVAQESLVDTNARLDGSQNTGITESRALERDPEEDGFRKRQTQSTIKNIF